MTLNEIKKYRKKDAHSYCLGSFPTFELLQTRPEMAEMILLHSDAKAEIRNKLKQECGKAGVKIVYSDRHMEKLRDKENCVVIGVFGKYHCRLEYDANHVVLVNPGDMGNLGTIIRSCVGFGITNLALIEPAADIFHPRAVRASMGAVFKIKFEYFPCFDQYYQEYGGERELYPFMLSGEHQLGTFEHSKNKPYSLIFGNEASGLDASYMNVGKSVVIPQTHSVDSLNLSLAAGIGIYEFCKINRRQKNQSVDCISQ
ncbi:MAG: TrmH family RNA methyltransferase [Acetatifactor sp.]|nr:TrmH family RNA methyltransferase [Acetatifactor sp.]